MAASATPAARCAIPDTPLAAAAAGLDACVHCGFCMQACPTYLALGDENDSPRGRLVLMRSLLEGDVAVGDPDLATHIGQCLGCRACETACPSGVPYGALLEATRATLGGARGDRTPWPGRVILGVFARPALLRIAMLFTRAARALGIGRVLARLRGSMGFAGAMLESSRPFVRTKHYEPSASTDRGTVALLHGCVMEGLFAGTNRATERVLRANGYRVVSVARQQCCGALHAHAGELDEARRLARANIAAFERAMPDHIAVNAAGCGAMLKEYAHLLQDDPEWHGRAMQIATRTRDISELLAAAGPRPAGSRARPLRVAYDAPCHLLHAQRVAAQPLGTLGAAAVELVPLEDADQCCGGAGIYNLLHPDVSASVLDAKLDRIADARVDVVATGNPGCLMQIGAGLLRRGMPTRVVHPVDLLDAAYAEAHSANHSQ
ncbi:MAG TPA: heterodisulfide reductase-related iron-sulfur binding cluster [Gemmatimonadaceae bacterium]|nr:heterodisulfide reductase-related iron-sulfur binding cluster [Gemmatimonadaceae bacterium]